MDVTQPLHRAMQLVPDRPFTVLGDRVRTVAESGDRIARFAGALVGLGVQNGDRVAIMSLNSDIFHEALLGIPWAGGAVVPVNYRWSPKEIAISLEECGVTVILVDDNFLGLIQLACALFWYRRLHRLGRCQPKRGSQTP